MLTAMPAVKSVYSFNEVVVSSNLMMKASGTHAQLSPGHLFAGSFTSQRVLGVCACASADHPTSAPRAPNKATFRMDPSPSRLLDEDFPVRDGSTWVDFLVPGRDRAGERGFQTLLNLTNVFLGAEYSAREIPASFLRHHRIPARGPEL